MKAHGMAQKWWANGRKGEQRNRQREKFVPPIFVEFVENKTKYLARLHDLMSF